MAGQFFRWPADWSTVPNFLAWARGFSNCMAGIGWVKTTDTGQVNWATQVATMTITQATAAGTTATYTYSNTTGAPITNGMWITITGFVVNNNFNVTSGTIASLNTGAHTFTLTVVSTTTTETSTTATATAATGLPQMISTSCYEIWRMTDANQTACPVFLRVEYWSGGDRTYGGIIKFYLGQSTTGNGIPMGGMTGFNTAPPAYGCTWGLLEDCWFNGGPNWMAVMMWRTSGSYVAPFYFAVERSKDNNGNDTADYVTQIGVAYSPSMSQQTMFKPGFGGPTPGEPAYSWVYLASGNANSSFGNNTACSPIFPWVGKADNPMISTCLADASAMGEGAIGNLTLYGISHPYIFSGNQYLCWAGAYQNGLKVKRIGMRWD